MIKLAQLLNPTQIQRLEKPLTIIMNETMSTVTAFTLPFTISTIFINERILQN